MKAGIALAAYTYLEGNLLFPTSLIMKIRGWRVGCPHLDFHCERGYLFICLFLILWQQYCCCHPCLGMAHPLSGSHRWWGPFWKKGSVLWDEVPECWGGVWVIVAFLLQAWRDRNCDCGWERAFWRDQGAAPCAAGESDHTFQVKAQSPGWMREERFPHSSLL